MQKITLSINDQKVAVPPGSSILTAAASKNIHIPTLCAHPDLKPSGACRICLVEDQKNGRLLASCVTPVSQDMLVHTQSPKVLEHRRNIVRLLLAEHPESCILCSKGNRCELRNISAQLGIGNNPLYPMPNHWPYEQLNPFIRRDLSKCILCGRCIRADQELVAVGAIGYNLRGFQSRPATLHQTSLEDSNCTFCGTCVSICPTGALSSNLCSSEATPDRNILSVCGYCAVGCRIDLGVSGNKLLGVDPAKLQDTVNGSTLCVRGHFAQDFLQSPDRLLSPLVRQQEDEQDKQLYIEVSWDEALEEVAHQFSRIRREYGPQSLAFIGSTRCSNEENYLFQKMGRVVFESNNLDSTGHYYGQDLLLALEQKNLGLQRSFRLSRLEEAEVIINVCTDPDRTLPVVGYHIKRAVRKGACLLHIHPEKNGLSQFSSFWFRPRQADNSLFLIAEIIYLLARKFIDLQLLDEEFIAASTRGAESFIQECEQLDLEKSCKRLDIEPRQIEEAAARLKSSKICIVLPPDIFHLPGGEQLPDALFSLSLLTGNAHSGPAKIIVLYQENNLVGALDMGVNPDYFPGRRSIKVEAEKKSLEQAWKVGLSSEPGMDLLDMIEEMERGNIRAAYVMGENLLRALPQPGRVEAALKSLEFLVVQDIFKSETAQLAHIIFPAAAFAEKGGSYTNMEGRIQNFQPALPPPGEAKPDWEILALFLRKMGYTEQYASVDKIRQEIRRVVPMYSGLGNHHQDWLRDLPSEDGKMHKNFRFSFSKAQKPKTQPVDQRFPYLAQIDGNRQHLGSGTRTIRSRRFQASLSKDRIKISELDLSNLKFPREGKVRLTSHYGSLEGDYTGSAEVKPGRIKIPGGYKRNRIMQLMPFARPQGADNFGWVACRVKIEGI